jgi:uncharacterized protein DUF3558
MGVITKPVDVTDLIARPCDALRSDQALVLGFPTPPRQDPSQVLGSAQCVWTTVPDTGATGDGPTFVLRVIAVSQPYLRPLEGPGVPPLTVISGYPAVVRPATPLVPFCDIEVKTAPHQSLTVSYGSFVAAELLAPCDQASRVTAVILSNLPPVGAR